MNQDMHLHRRSFIQQMQAGRKLRFETAWSRLNLHYLESETPLIVQLVARQTGVIHSIGLNREQTRELRDFLQQCLGDSTEENAVLAEHLRQAYVVIEKLNEELRLKS